NMSASAVVRRLAALSGASAVGAGLSLIFSESSVCVCVPLQLFETANKYHFYHSLALLGKPKTLTLGWMHLAQSFKVDIVPQSYLLLPVHLHSEILCYRDCCFITL
uniref:Uncharacterized protein n=1 Tax=Pundamilia nyererei TaxID=303518 RepID=A0A3B4GGK5_9CICH